MTSEEEKFCVEKPEQKQTEEHENKRVMISLAVLLGLTVLVGGLLDFFFAGVSLGFHLTIDKCSSNVKRRFVLCCRFFLLLHTLV